MRSREEILHLGVKSEKLETIIAVFNLIAVWRIDGDVKEISFVFFLMRYFG